MTRAPFVLAADMGKPDSGEIPMAREICKDEAFLTQKARPAAAGIIRHEIDRCKGVTI